MSGGGRLRSVAEVSGGQSLRSLEVSGVWWRTSVEIGDGGWWRWVAKSYFRQPGSNDRQ